MTPDSFFRILLHAMLISLDFMLIEDLAGIVMDSLWYRFILFIAHNPLFTLHRHS